MAKSRVIKRQRYYDWASFTDKQSGEVTLLVRDFEARLLPSGKVHVHRKTDGLTFASEDEMVSAIHDQEMRGLPESAWGDRDYTPLAFRRERLQARAA